MREHTNVASTKAVILVSFLIPTALKTRLLLVEINRSVLRWVVRQEELVSGLCLLMFQRLVFARIQAPHTESKFQSNANSRYSLYSKSLVIRLSTTASRLSQRSPSFMKLSLLATTMRAFSATSSKTPSKNSPNFGFHTFENTQRWELPEVCTISAMPS